MTACVANLMGGPEAFIAMAVIAAWLVLMCLKTICEDIEHAGRWHALKLEVQRLRDMQQKRIKELNHKHRRGQG